ncbi:hypothetical protein DL98DRAFT_169945 [Cadophora sp. DSE1049]|nr:hypothetical protein DL98DRAFT_169945 [Cadophora sp. DSE1049]
MLDAVICYRLLIYLFCLRLGSSGPRNPRNSDSHVSEQVNTLPMFSSGISRYSFYILVNEAYSHHFVHLLLGLPSLV